jgi:uncharacterized protein YbaP (TraB family)
MSFAQRFRRACIPFFVFLILFCSSLTAQARTFLWEARSGQATVYLLGSIHFANESFYPMAPVIENAFAASDTLVLELNPLAIDQAEMQRLVMEKGFYPEGETLKDHLSPELMGMLEVYLLKNHLRPEGMMRMKPGMVAITLTSIQFMKMGYLPHLGIDMYFAKQARGAKRVIELETMEYQLDLLLDASDEELFLEYTLRDLETAEQMFQTVIDSWRNGDTEAVNELVVEQYTREPELRPVMDRLFFDRNAAMANQIRDFLETDQVFFVVVGAGHLVGDRGIVQLLEDEGYDVQQR